MKKKAWERLLSAPESAAEKTERAVGRRPVRRSGVDWIVFDALCQEMVCRRCGAVEKAVLPQPVSAFVRWSRQLIERHADCQPAPGVTP